MKKLFSILTAAAVALLDFAASGQVKISQLPATNTLANLDYLIIDKTNSGAGTFTTYRIPLNQFGTNASLVNVISNSISGAYVLAQAGVGINNNFTGPLINGASAFCTNGAVPANVQLSVGTGNSYLTISGTGASVFMSTVGLGDTITMSNNQWMVVSITNGNNTLGVLFKSQVTAASVPFTWFQNPFRLYDTVPRVTGGITGGTGFGVAGWSIANNGGVGGGYYLWDGIYSTSFQNVPAGGARPPYSTISVAPGLVVNGGNQFAIVSGSQYDDLVIQANDDIWMRGWFSNEFGPNVLSRQQILAPGFIGTNSMTYANTAAAATGLTATASTGQFYVTLSGQPLANNINLMDELTINGNVYMVTGLTNASSIVSIWPTAQNSFTNSTVTISKANNVMTNGNLGALTSGISASGNHCFVGTSIANNAFPYGSFYLDGDNTSFIGNQSAANFIIQSGNGSGGTGSQFAMQRGGLFNTLVMYAFSAVGVRELTNSGAAGALQVDCGLNVLNGNVQAAQNLQALSVITTGHSGSQVISNITVTASPMSWTNVTGTNIFLYCDAGTVSAIQVGNSFALTTVFTSTGKTVALQPNDKVVVTYSSAPNLAYAKW